MELRFSEGHGICFDIEDYVGIEGKAKFAASAALPMMRAGSRRGLRDRLGVLGAHMTPRMSRTGKHRWVNIGI